MKQVFDQEIVLKLKQFLSEPKKIIVTTHYKPDGDALGSSLAWASYLEKKGHEVTIISPSEFPEFLSWMHKSETVIDFILHPKQAKTAFENADFICCLDFNDPQRVEGMQNLLVSNTIPKMLIDHHLEPKDFCEFQFSDPKIASTCEMIYHLINELGDANTIDQNQAECIYAGIMTDTGSFRFSSVTSTTHRVVAELLDAGARNSFIHEKIYDTSSENRLRFLGHSLLNEMKVIESLNTVYFKATKEDMQKFKHASGDSEGIVNFGLSIKGIRFAAFFSERDNIVKISFRSKGDFSAKDFAMNHFEGGGHKNAAGGRSNLSLQETVEKFETLLTNYSESLTS